METKYEASKGINEWHEKLDKEIKKTKTEELPYTKKSKLDENIFKIAIGSIYGFDINLKTLFDKAGKALNKPSLSHQVNTFYFLKEMDYYSINNELVITVKVMPFYKKNNFLNSSGLHAEHMFIFSFMSHFQ